MDRDSGIIRKAERTQVRVREHEIFHELISGNEKAISTDKACYDKQRAREIEAKGIKNGLMMKKAHGGAPISKEDRKRNKEISKIGTQVERPFAIIMSKWGTCSRWIYWTFRKPDSSSPNLHDIYADEPVH